VSVALVENTPAAWDRRARRAASDWEASMWSEHGQTARFVAAVRHLELRPSDALLDFGCGTGRLVEFVPRNVSYVGVDSAGSMLQRAKENRRRGSFFQGVPPWKFDHVVAVGTFNLADGWSKARTWQVLDQLWEDKARRTLVASLYRGADPGCLSYTPAEAVAYAASKTTEFVVDCSYLENDLMVVLRRTGAL